MDITPSFYVAHNGLINLASGSSRCMVNMTDWHGSYELTNLQLKNIKDNWINYADLFLLDKLITIIIEYIKIKTQKSKLLEDNLDSSILFSLCNKRHSLIHYEYLMVKHLIYIDSIITIQRAVKYKNQIRMLQLSEKSATTIQRLWRRYREKYIYDLLKALHKINIRLCKVQCVKEINSARLIQQFWYSHKNRKKFFLKRKHIIERELRYDKAATKIQKLWRQERDGWCIV